MRLYKLLAYRENQYRVSMAIREMIAMLIIIKILQVVVVVQADMHSASQNHLAADRTKMLWQMRSFMSWCHT